MSEESDKNSDLKSTPKLAGANLPLAMTRQQAEVFDLLRGLSGEGENFHEWYQGAIQVLETQSPDRIAQAANSIRELCDRLPDRIANIPKFVSPVAPVKSLQRDFLGIKASDYAEGWQDKTINARLAKLLLRLDEIFILSNEPPRTARLKLALTASDPQAEFMSNEYLKARDDTFKKIGIFFQNVTHHNRKVDESEFRKELHLFESLLLNYLTPCTAIQQTELLSLIAGQPSPETWARIHELISHKGANYVFFFEKLDNPLWLRPLEENGHFASLPPPEPVGEGRFVYRIHVPLIALAKLAAASPHEVTNILIKLKLPDNSRIGDQILQCLSKVKEPRCIQQLGPLIAQLAENSTRTSWLWIHETLQLWIELKVYEEVFAILGGYLNSEVNKSFEQHQTWLAKQIDEQCLEKLTPLHPVRVIELIFQALCKWTEQERSKYSQSDIDDDTPASYFVEDFKSAPLEYRGIEAILARRLFLAAHQIYLQGELPIIDRIDQLFVSNRWQLFRRLRWQLYADFPTISLGRARAEVLKRIPFLSEMDYDRGSHDFEFAQLLVAHIKHYGQAFLAPIEVEQFASNVLKGPIDKKGFPIEGNNEFFYRKQLWPIAPLLQGERLAAYRVLVPDDSEISIESFKPYGSRGVSGGFVASKAPKETENFETMTDAELWNFLNTWEPKAGYEYGSNGKLSHENIFEVAAKFAELVHKLPQRFDPATKWWESIKRWEVLNKLLDKAADRISNQQNGSQTSMPSPTESDWANWFGIIEYLVNQPCTQHATARFIFTGLKSECVIPEQCLSKLPKLLGRLVAEVDEQLSKSANSFGDWLTTAINSVRGTAVEALFSLALRQKNAGKEIEPWIFETLRSRLESPDESPAINALFGANLCLLIHLFGGKIKELSNLLLPPSKPEHRSATIVAHFKYGRPWNAIIESFPRFIADALDTLESIEAEAENDKSNDDRRDFGEKLGTHIACYYWSGSFATELEAETALDRFFDVASPQIRARLISQIASIWENDADAPRDEKVIGRVLAIWERRYARIEKDLKIDGTSTVYDGELAESIDWLSCEPFPFAWRFSHANSSLKKLKKAPQAYRLLKAISEFSATQKRLESMLELLQTLLKRPSDELRWSIQFKEIAHVISLGLADSNSNSKKLAAECKDLLLKMGFSDFLNLGNESNK